MIGSTCSSEEHGLTVLTHKSFTVADLANSCNYIISLGEAEGCASLFAASKNYHGEFSYPERVSWIIRVVFISNTPDPLRQPSYGELSLPYESMLLATWPKFPVAQSDLVFFVLSEGYSLSGYPENPTAYLEYCKSNGTMRREPVLIPDSKVATKHLIA